MQPYRRLHLFRSSFTGWALGLALLLGGCGGGSSGGDEPIASVTAEVGASGGAVALQGLALTVAPNAVTGPVTVGVVALTAGTGEIARFQLSPAGRALGVASELRFSRAGLPAKTSFFWDVGGELRLVPSTLVGDVLTAQVSSLGLSASGGVVSALASTPAGRLKALFAKTLADAPGDGGTVVVKPLDCAADIATMAARLKVVASGRDQELTIRFYDELVAVKQLCLEAEVQALKESSCDALGTALFKAETVLADSFLTFQELTLPLFAAEAFVQETGATCPSADSARVGPLIADKFDQFLRVLQSQQLRGGFAEEATARDLQTLLSFKASCDLLGLDAVCDRLDNEIIPNLFDGMRRGAFDECRSSGSPLVVSQLHFLGTMVTDTDRFLGVGRFGLGDVEADLMYCTNPTLDLRVFADATGVPDELKDRATTLSPLVGLGNYARVKTIELPRDGSLTVAGDVAALRCADGSVSTADLVARIGTREVARRSVSGNFYTLSTAPLDLVVSRMLASAGLDVDTTKSFTVSINREGGQCLGVLGPTLNEDRTMFEIPVNLPPEPVVPGLFRGPVLLQVTDVQAGFQRQTETLSYRTDVNFSAELEQLPFGQFQFNRVVAQVDSVVSVVDRRKLGNGGTCTFTRTDERVSTTRGTVQVPTLAVGQPLEIDTGQAGWRLITFSFKVPLGSQVVETRRFTDVHPSCSGIDFTNTSRISVTEDPFSIVFFSSEATSDGKVLSGPIVTDGSGKSSIDVTGSRTIDGGDGQSFKRTSISMQLADR